MNNYKKYLPSKKFIIVVIFIIILIMVFLAVKGIVSYLKNRKINNSEPVPMTIGSIIQKDSNNNGIADWEEYLWGLNPDKDGEKNKEFIMNKKKELAQNNEFINLDDSKSISENELLSREFFATIVSLQQTGNITEESLNSVSEIIGRKIEAPIIDDIYDTRSLILQSDTELSNEKYLENFDNLVVKYENSDIGSELTLISQGLGNNDPQALYAAKTIASAYRSFGEELIKIPVPDSLAEIHLRLANNYEKTGQSIEGLTQTLLDPIIAMRAIINYKKYSDALVSDLEELSRILQ